MIYLLAGLVIGVIAVGWFAFERLRHAYEDQICMLEEDRDLARYEAKTYLGLLCPVTNRAEAVLGDAGRSLSGQAAPRASAPRASASPKTSSVISASAPLQRPVRSRVPFRMRFNLARKLSNTKQQKTDALATALAQQKPFKEKSNVET